jgi:uncharacterized protein (UPF0333 family)
VCKKIRSRKGQVVIEYMLLVAVGVIAIIGATQLFNKLVLKAISDGISERVATQCSGCKK